MLDKELLDDTAAFRQRTREQRRTSVCVARAQVIHSKCGSSRAQAAISTTLHPKIHSAVVDVNHVPQDTDRTKARVECSLICFFHFANWRKKKEELILMIRWSPRLICKIFPTQDGWFIEDLGSTNGTTVDGQLIRNSQIRPGAEITIGNSRMILFVGLAGQRDEQEPPASAQQQVDITMAASRGTSRAGRETRSHQRWQRYPHRSRSSPAPSMRAELGLSPAKTWGIFTKFENGNMIIGRRTGAVPLSDGEVSKYHAVIEIFGRNMIFLRDRESTNGTFHNGRRILSAKLQNSDTIGLGRSVLRLRVR